MPDTIKPVLTMDVLRERRDLILRLAAEYGATQVRVFGSVARGEATPESDIDLLMHFDEQTDIFDLVGLWLALKDQLGCEINVISDGTQDERFMQRILKDAVPL